MRNIFRNRKLTPHGICLSPIIIIADQNYVLVIVKVFFVRSGSYQIVHLIHFNCFSIVVVSVSYGLQIVFLHDIKHWKISFLKNRVNCFAGVIVCQFEDYGTVILCNNICNVALHFSAGRRIVIYMCMIGSCYIFCSNRCAVIPFCVSFDFHCDLGTIVVPHWISVCKQRIHFCIQWIPHIKSFINKYT